MSWGCIGGVNAVNELRPQINYPILPIAERLKVVQDLIMLFESGLERFTSPNNERRVKTEFDASGKAKQTIEKEDKWKRRIERCADIKDNILPHLRDIENVLSDKGAQSLSDDIEIIKRLIKIFQDSLSDADMKPEDKELIRVSTIPQLNDVLYTLELIRYGD
jgi:hypothetical protein